MKSLIGAVLLLAAGMASSGQITVCTSTVPQGWNLACSYDLTSKGQDRITLKAMYESGWSLVDMEEVVKDQYSKEYIFFFEKRGK